MLTLQYSNLKKDWLANVRGDVLAGLVVALALIPEAIAFSIIAGVDPKVGLYASFSIAVISAFTGGRPGMISAVTAATAVLMVTLVKVHGLQYLLATTILAGFFQIGFGFIFITIGARTTPSATVGIIMLSESVLGPLWAFLFVSERPSMFALVGGAIILSAVLLQFYSLLSKNNKSVSH